MWPGPAGGAGEDVERGGARCAPTGPRSDRGVEVALDGAVLADERPALVEREAPVEADHVAAGGGHRREERAAPVPKWIDGTPASASAARTRAEAGAANSS